MGKKHYKDRPALDKGYVYNQSEALNRMTYMYHFQNLYEIALNRIKWVNLPDGCNERFLEETLLLNGQAILFKKPKLFGGNFFFSTRVIATGPLNVYNNPTRLRSVGNNGWNLSVPWRDGVLIWETKSRYPTINHIPIFANRLAETDRVADVNLQTMKRPFIITGPEEKYQEMVNLYKNIDTNEPAIIGLPAMRDIDVKVLQTGAEYLGDKMQYRKQLILNEFMTFLGIDNSGMEKQERMTEKEVKRNQGMIMMKRLNFLEPRREAAAIINKRYGTHIEVYWNEDNQTPTYNMEHNLEMQAEHEVLEEVNE